MAPGAYAEYIAVPASRVGRIPEGLSTKTAAASAIQGLTGLQALFFASRHH